MSREFREPDAATREKQSIKKQGMLNPNWQKPRSEETKKAISKRLKDYWSRIPSRDEANVSSENRPD